MSFRDLVLHRFDFLSHMACPGFFDRRVVYQFHLRDERFDEGRLSLNIVVDGETCIMQEGCAGAADCTIDVQYRFWQELQSNQVGLVRMIREMATGKRITVTGDQKLFRRLDALFAGSLDNSRFAPPADEFVPVVRPAGPWKQPGRVTILSCSGRDKTESSMYRLAHRFGEGCVRGPGAPTVELIHLADMHFAPCSGCFACWGSDGVCIHQDDFVTELLPRIVKTDVLVFAFPLYLYNTPPLLSALISRLFVNVHPLADYVPARGGINHFLRTPVGGALFLLAGCGFLDHRQFAAPLAQMKELCRRKGLRYCGELVETVASAHSFAAGKSPLMEEIEDAVSRAGEELVTRGRVSRKTRRIAQQPPMSRSRLRAVLAAYADNLKGLVSHGIPDEDQVFEPSPFDIAGSSAEGQAR